MTDEIKRRFRKGFKRRQKEAANLSHQADRQIEKFLVRRFERLASVKRFVALWTALLAVLFFATLTQLRALSPYYQVLRPAAGGIYSEGIVGNFTNSNPIYATGAADVSISHLVFDGLFKYNSKNVLVGDLATGWTLNSAQDVYTVHLRHNVKWQDGKPFTANDAVFTYQTIQNPDAQSAFYSNWQGIKVTKVNNYTVNFTLPDPLSSFPYSLTNGIIPAHVFKNIQPIQMRSANFNTDPIGTGPFEWKSVEVTGSSDSASPEQRMSLAAYGNYWAGKPKLDGFNLTTFPDDQHMLTAFNNKQINAMSGLDSVPTALNQNKDVHVYKTPLTSEVMAFLDNSNPLLSDATVRKAMVSSIDTRAIPSLLEYPARLVNSPLLPTQLGYDPTIAQLPYNPVSANQILDADGWTRQPDGTRSKNGQKLQFTLAAQNTPDYTQVAQFLQQQWSKLGVRVDVHYYDADDLQDTIIANHDYDILLYGINIGVDPDVFAYWDSSQASVSSQGHLNLSEYKSSAADQALEGARTRSDPTERAIKYKQFLTAWAGDAPALALYQPNFIYVSRGQVFNFSRSQINSDANRFDNISQWMIRQSRQTI